MPDGTAANRDEIDRAIEALTLGQLLKLKHFAAWLFTPSLFESEELYVQSQAIRVEVSAWDRFSSRGGRERSWRSM
jgi:hypothetical protein